MSTLPHSPPPVSASLVSFSKTQHFKGRIGISRLSAMLLRATKAFFLLVLENQVSAFVAKFLKRNKRI
jgi:hypothetical protein